MLTSLHFLLTYKCSYECDHCFVYSSPRSEGTFTIEQVEHALAQAVDAGVTSIYLEGGEPFLFYPLMVEALRIAKELGLSTGLVTNCYWATSVRDAELWLRPFGDLGIDDLSISDDAFHADDPEASPARSARMAAERLGLPLGAICIDPPVAEPAPERDAAGAVIGGDVLFKGRAADKLTADLPRRRFELFDSCPHEDLAAPGRVHLDPFGNVFICQGISIGNIGQRPLVEIMEQYRPLEHPVIGRLVAGGPAELANAYGLPDDESAVDHCHLCFITRRKLVDQYPDCLTPKAIYGVE